MNLNEKFPEKPRKLNLNFGYTGRRLPPDFVPLPMVAPSDAKEVARQKGWREFRHKKRKGERPRFGRREPLLLTESNRLPELWTFARSANSLPDQTSTL